MTSPASSSAASPFSGFGQSGPQASTSSQSAKPAPIKEQSYLEAIPVICPTIVPLEWSFPLIHRSKADNNDLGSVKVENATASGPDLQASAATPSFSQGPPSGVPPYLAAETPASLPAGPSPGNTSSFSTAGQAGNHIQKPWRIRWASYKAKAEVAVLSADSPMSPAPIRTGRASATSTPRAGLLQVPHVYANSPLNPISPTGSIFDKAKGRARARAASDASRKSGTSHYSERSRHKKRRLHGGAGSLDGDSAETLLRTYYGEEHQAEYDSFLEALADQKRSSAMKPLLNGKKHFLRGASPTRSTETSADGAPADRPKMKSYDSVVQHGLLPERLATIDRARPMASPTGPKPRMGEPRLYTFSLTSPDLDLSEYTGLDEANAYPDLEPEASGTFTASDLFPTLYNDNGIYTPPSSMHPASIHPIPSAAALGAGQNGSYGKVPFFLSSLNISSSSNTEAVAASDAFLKAVEEHILGAIQQSYHPAVDFAKTTSEHAKAPKSSKWLPSAGVSCGHGILFPSSGSQVSPPSQAAATSQATDTFPSLSASSIFLQCRAQFTAADVRVSAHMQCSTLQAITISADRAGAPPSSLKHGLSASSSEHQLKYGEIILLCPMSLPAVFLRWYGAASDTISRKQAAIERENTHVRRADMLECMGDDAVDISPDEAWLLCSFGKGNDIVWPASLALRASCRSQSQRDTRNIRRKTPTTRIKSSISKASSRMSRKLYFRTRASTSANLVATSLNHIEQQNTARARERRDKAEKSMMGATVNSDTPQTATAASVKTRSTLQEDGEIGEIAIIQPKAEKSQSGEVSAIYDSASLLNGLGCPTLESISQAIDELAGPEPVITAHPAQQPVIHVDGVLNISNDTTQQGHKENGGLYPTPQSGPSSTNHQPLEPQESQDMASRSTEVPSFPEVDGSRSIADILGDFTWPSYADNGRGPSGHVSSRPTSSGGVGYAPKGVFDDPSTFDMFDSAGLTEEDFSFFDSPIPSSILENSHSLPNTFDFHDDKLQPIHAITADDLASFVQTGPVDHFGHLMPRGASQPAPVPGQPSASQDVVSYSSHDNAATPSDNTSGISQTEVHFTSSPAHRGAVLPTITRAGLATGKIAMIGSQRENLARDNIRPKYHLSLSTGPDLHLSASARNRMVGRASVWTVEAFRPAKFKLPSPPHWVTSGLLEESRPAWGNKDYLRQQQEERGLKVKSAYLKPTKAVLMHGDRECLPRHWKEDDHLAVTLSDSTYATSSDNDSDGLKSSPDLDTDREHPYTLNKELLAATVLFGLGTSIQNALGVSVPQTQSALNRSKEASAKVSRGEKEAIATIFFQHTIENIDFRERHNSQYVKPLQSFAVSPAYPVLPRVGVCKRLVNVQATEIAISRQDAIATVSVAAVSNWTRLGLKPHSGPKDIQAVVIAPLLLADRIVESALADWLCSVAAVWKSLGFGKHSTGPIDDCFFKLDCGSAYLSESADSQTALARISGVLTSRIAGDHACVIYVLVDDSECQKPESNLMYLCLRLHLLRKGAIPQIIPLSALSRNFSSIPSYEHGSTHDAALNRFAFNVYDRLPVCVTRYSKDKGGPNSISTLLPEISTLGGQFVRTFVAPAFYVAPRTLPQLALQLQWPPPALDILDASRLFHVAYQVSEDRKWLYLAATDDKAEYHCLRVRYIETLDLKVILRRVWSFMKEASESAAVQWRICISRVGTMPVNEVQAWSEILQNAMLQLAHPAMVTILSLMPVTSTTYEAHQPAASASNILLPLSGISLATTPEALYVDGTVRALVSHSPYPTAIYSNDNEESGDLPNTSEKVYYALASSSVYFPIGRVDAQASETTIKPASDSYSLNLLAVAAHPLSTYNRQLASHMIDLAQSYVDMCVIARERWALGSGETGRAAVSHLPWHLQAVTYMPTFSVDSLLQS